MVQKKICKCIESSYYFDKLPNRTKNKLNQVKHMIKDSYPEIIHIDIDSETVANRNGNLVGFEMTFELSSDHEVIDNLQVTVSFSKSLCDVHASSIFRAFRREYDDYVKFANIKFR